MNRALYTASVLIALTSAAAAVEVDPSILVGTFTTADPERLYYTSEHIEFLRDHTFRYTTWSDMGGGRPVRTGFYGRRGNQIRLIGLTEYRGRTLFYAVADGIEVLLPTFDDYLRFVRSKTLPERFFRRKTQPRGAP